MGTAVDARAGGARERCRPAPRNSRAWSSTNLTADNEIGVPALRGLSLQVKPHEIVGIAGVSGNGQRELVQVLAGQRNADAAARSWCTASTTRHAARRSAGITSTSCRRCRCKTPASATMTTAENLAFRSFDRPPLTLGRLVPEPRRDASRAPRI